MSKIVETGKTGGKKPSVVLIIDRKQRDTMLNKLPREYSWEVFTVDSVRNISSLEDTESFRSALSKSFVIVLFVGTSDLISHAASASKHNNGNTETIFEYISATCNKLSQEKQVIIITVPPTRIAGTLGEVPVLNAMIVRELKEKCKVIDNHKKFSAKLKSIVVADDGVTMTSYTADIIVNDLSTELAGLNTDTARQGTEHVSTPKAEQSRPTSAGSVPRPSAHGQVMVEVPVLYMKHVVGKNRRVLNKIENDAGVKIETKKWKDNEVQKEGVLIKGKRAEIDQAVATIKSVISEQKNKPSEMGPCKFYKNGSCFKGENCPFSHNECESQPELIKLT